MNYISKLHAVVVDKKLKKSPTFVKFLSSAIQNEMFMRKNELVKIVLVIENHYIINL